MSGLTNQERLVETIQLSLTAVTMLQQEPRLRVGVGEKMKETEVKLQRLLNKLDGHPER